MTLLPCRYQAKIAESEVHINKVTEETNVLTARAKELESKLAGFEQSQKKDREDSEAR